MRLAVALALVVGVLAVSAYGQQTATEGRINVTATLTHATGRAAGPPGRRSDASEQVWRINGDQGRELGRMLMQCRWISARARLCAGELQMPTGKLTFLGSSATPFEGEYAITGGTGEFRAGGGVMLFTAIGLRKTVLLVTVDR